MKAVLITRPAAEAAITARDVAELGFRPVVAPVLTIENADTPWPDPAAFAALALTSARAVPVVPPAWRAADLPVFAVGGGTAAAARAAGFTRVAAADGGVGSLAAMLNGRSGDRAARAGG